MIPQQISAKQPSPEEIAAAVAASEARAGAGAAQGGAAPQAPENKIQQFLHALGIGVQSVPPEAIVPSLTAPQSQSVLSGNSAVAGGNLPQSYLAQGADAMRSAGRAGVGVVKNAVGGALNLAEHPIDNAPTIGNIALQTGLSFVPGTQEFTIPMLLTRILGAGAVGTAGGALRGDEHPTNAGIEQMGAQALGETGVGLLKGGGQAAGWLARKAGMAGLSPSVNVLSEMRDPATGAPYPNTIRAAKAMERTVLTDAPGRPGGAPYQESLTRQLNAANNRQEAGIVAADARNPNGTISPSVALDNGFADLQHRPLFASNVAQAQAQLNAVRDRFDPNFQWSVSHPNTGSPDTLTHGTVQRLGAAQGYTPNSPLTLDFVRKQIASLDDELAPIYKGQALKLKTGQNLPEQDLDTQALSQIRRNFNEALGQAGGPEVTEARADIHRLKPIQKAATEAARPVFGTNPQVRLGTSGPSIRDWIHIGESGLARPLEASGKALDTAATVGPGRGTALGQLIYLLMSGKPQTP